MRKNLVAFCSGLLFAVGLCVSGMTQPSKVLGFLDFTGRWDASLACVMAGAMGVYFLAARWSRTARSPLLASSFRLPARREVDAPLVLGSVIFGVGWGLAGYCPGPAVASVGALAPSTMTFVGAMLVGMLAFRVVEKTLTSPSHATTARAARDPS